MSVPDSFVGFAYEFAWLLGRDTAAGSGRINRCAPGVKESCGGA